MCIFCATAIELASGRVHKYHPKKQLWYLMWVWRPFYKHLLFLRFLEYYLSINYVSLIAHSRYFVRNFKRTKLVGLWIASFSVQWIFAIHCYIFIDNFAGNIIQYLIKCIPNMLNVLSGLPPPDVLTQHIQLQMDKFHSHLLFHRKLV